jgi:threonine dehydratase
MPVTTPEIKISSVKSFGANIVLAGDSYSDAAEEAARLVKEKGYTFIPPYDDPDVIAGQGTVAMEVLRQYSGKIDAIFVPVGGGGFAAGVAVYVKSVRPDIKVFGVEPADPRHVLVGHACGELSELAVGYPTDDRIPDRPPLAVLVPEHTITPVPYLRRCI